LTVYQKKLRKLRTRTEQTTRARRVWSGYPDDITTHPTPSELESLRDRIESCRQIHVELCGNENYPYWDDVTIAEYLGGRNGCSAHRTHLTNA